jgi:hypothetical protein
MKTLSQLIKAKKKEIEKEGYRAANISELLSWKDWNDKDWVAALGSVAAVDDSRSVPFLAVRNTKNLGNSETFESLALRITKIEKTLKDHNL